jgi:superfamily II DNA or RNA helicase
MFSSFTNLFKKDESAKLDMNREINELMNGLEDAEAAAAAAASPFTEEDIQLLDENAPRMSSPANPGGIMLWPHQQAMLARCAAVEAACGKASVEVKNKIRYMDKSAVPPATEVNIGIMNDPPGSGKTYAILALILADASREGLNLIVVPQNIYTQWAGAISAMFPKNTYKCCDKYGDIVALYTSPTLFNEYSVILVNELFAETLAQSIYDNGVKVKRLIIDEIDSVESRMSTPIYADYVWLVSASFVFDGMKGAVAGPYTIPRDTLAHVVCKCTPEFISKSLHFDAPIVKKYICDDNEIDLLRDIIDEKIIMSLNAGDIGALVKSMKNQYPPVDHTILTLTRHLAAEYLGEKSNVEYYSKLLEDVDNESTDKALNEISKMRYTSMRRGYEALVEKGRLLEKRLATYIASEKTKIDIFYDEICAAILADKGSKWLMFNDNMAALITYQTILDEHSIRAKTLDGGDAKRIADIIKEYKEGDIQVLLINSRMEGAGMNLENTTHLVFMHATEPRLIEQIVGRAQRYGRKGALNVIGLFNKNENNCCIDVSA